jgi:hypothetical protein
MNDSRSTENGPAIGLAVESWLAASRESINRAKKFADAHEVALGWFVLRDTEAVKRSGMSDLAWSGHREGVTLGELRWFAGELERFLSANNQGDTRHE